MQCFNKCFNRPLVRTGLFLCVLAGAVWTNAQGTSWTVTMGTDDQFDPDSLTVALGDSVTWINADQDPHTSTSGSDCTSDGGWDSGTLLLGDAFTFVTDEAGRFPYFCNFHCGMGMVGLLEVIQPTPTTDGTWGTIKTLYRD